MARYRQVHLSFWQDGFVIELTPEEKYFYLYLMTNSKTTQCGIYELPYKVMELETGYNRETVEKLIYRFEEYGKIIYNEPTKEIMVLNWIKFNWINSKKVLTLIDKELKSVKHQWFVQVFLNICKDFKYPIDTLSIDYGEEEEEEREEEREEEQEQEAENDVYVFYQNNFGVISPFIADNIKNWVDDLSEELVLESMKIALKGNKPFNYAEAILKNWYKNNIKTLDDVEADRKAHERKSDSHNRRSKKDEIGESSYK